MSKPTLVLVAAHADDAELNAGGLMTKWVNKGGRVVVVMVTNNINATVIPPDGDESKTGPVPPDVMQALRESEQVAACKLIGAELIFLGYSQRHYWNGKKTTSIDFQHAEPHPACVGKAPPLIIAFRYPEAINHVRGVLEGLNPTLVLTQTMIDLDQEHHATACLVWQAMKQSESLKKVPLYFWTPGSSAMEGLIAPDYDHIEDISNEYPMKVKLCAAHFSQWSTLRKGMVQKHSEHWGKAIGTAYGEPFKRANFSGAEPGQTAKAKTFLEMF